MLNDVVCFCISISDMNYILMVGKVKYQNLIFDAFFLLKYCFRLLFDNIKY